MFDPVTVLAFVSAGLCAMVCWAIVRADLPGLFYPPEDLRHQDDWKHEGSGL